MRLGIYLVAVLLMCGTGVAQEVAYVDARQGSEKQPRSDVGTGYGGAACDEKGCHSKLRTELVKLTSYQQDGTRFAEWTVRVINESGEAIKMPTGLTWSSNADLEAPNRKVVLELVIGESASCSKEDGSAPRQMFDSVTLFGSAKASSDTTRLESGQWMTVIGKGPACEFPSTNTDTYDFSSTVFRVAWYRDGDRNLEDSMPLTDDGLGVKVHWNADHDWVKAQTAQSR